MLRLLPRPRWRPTARDWWDYFGSFGDDFFGDDPLDGGDDPSEADQLTELDSDVDPPAPSTRQLLSCGTNSLAGSWRSIRRARRATRCSHRRQ